MLGDWIIRGGMMMMLALLGYQDLKSRQVSWVIFPFLFVGAIWLGKTKVGWEGAGLNAIINICILGIQMLVMMAYFKMKGIGMKDLLKSYIGLGDLLMFLVVAMLCAPLNYLPFFIGSLIVSIILFLGYNAIVSEKRKAKSIPLAGLQAIMIIITFLTPMDLYEDKFMVDLITTS